MPTKSIKADGTAKKRWSAAERAARGHAPRRSGGKPRGRNATEEKSGRGSREPKTVGESWTPRDDRSTARATTRRAARPDSAEWPGRAARKNSSRSYSRTSGDDRTRTSTPRPAVGPVEHSPGRRAIESPAARRVVSRATVPATADFQALGLPPRLVEQLAQAGIDTPFPIQAATIPAALAGRDVLGRAQTGSGKTLAFGLPMITTLSAAPAGPARPPRGLVLAPTRELAMQVTDALSPLARAAGLSTVLVAGGMSYTPQLRALQRGVDIVVATPGRLIDLFEQGAVDLGRIEVTVLDEADHMADLGFLPAVTQLLDAVPGDGQRLLFSATLDGAVDQLVTRYLSDPIIAQVDSAKASVTTMAHHVVHVDPKDKARVTAEIAARPGRTVIFVRTQLGADRVAEQLRGAGVLAGSLHGGLAQGARTRTLAAFRDGTLPALVATDVAARGIHVDDVGLVLQVDPPNGGKEYLHRAGRTARAGDTGQVVTLVLPHQRRDVSRLLAGAGVRGTELPATAGNPRLAAVTGARPGDAAPISEADYLRLIAPPAARRPPTGRPGQSRRGDHRAQRRSAGARRDTTISRGGTTPLTPEQAM
jgi:superfamily II DNA/RNA helicase